MFTKIIKNNILALALLSIYCSAPMAAIIAEIPLSSWSKPSGYYTSFTFKAEYLNYPTNLGLGLSRIDGTAIFDSISITPADVGSSFSIASNTDDPEYTNFLSYLTNETDDQLMFWYLVNGAGGPGSDNPESSIFTTTSGVDLSGYNIDEISLRVDSLTMTRVFQSPCNRTTGCTETSFSGALVFSGNVATVPLPTPLFLLVSGFLAYLPLTIHSSRRKKRAAE